MSLVSAVVFQVEVSSSGWSFVQMSPTGCGVSECDREVSKKRTRWPTGDWYAMEKNLRKQELDLTGSNMAQVNWWNFGFRNNIQFLVQMCYCQFQTLSIYWNRFLWGQQSRRLRIFYLRTPTNPFSETTCVNFVIYPTMEKLQKTNNSSVY
jgi:hypothetical protein